MHASSSSSQGAASPGQVQPASSQQVDSTATSGVGSFPDAIDDVSAEVGRRKAQQG
jgi:hypothetical protein